MTVSKEFPLQDGISASLMGSDAPLATFAALSQVPPSFGYSPMETPAEKEPVTGFFQDHSQASRFGRRQWRKPATYAALDLGTNNCRLLVAQPLHQGFRVIDAFSRIVRLGEGLALTNALGEAAIERAVEALKVCESKIVTRGVSRVRLIATEACRVATNGRAFIDRVYDEIGLRLEVIDRQTEAYLAAAGCVTLVDAEAQGVILFDIGGGSTEIVWLGPRSDGNDVAERMRDWVSLPVGVVNLAERYGGNQVTTEIFEAMIQEVSEGFADFAERAHEANQAKGFHLLGTSGTVTTIAGVYLNLPRYDRRRVDGLWMSNTEITQVIDRLAGLDFEGRAATPCIGRERADLVLAGCAIFEAIRRAFPSSRVRIADRGLREGMLVGMMRDDGVWRRRSYS